MLDKYVLGKVSRISPEAPVPVLECVSEEVRLGGAANVALNVAALGGVPLLVGLRGADIEGSSLIKLLEEAELSSTGIVPSSQRRTTVKARVIASNQHIVRVDYETTAPLSSSEAESLIERLQTILDAEEIDVIVLQDYNKGVLSLPVIQFLLQESDRQNIPVAVDPKSKNFWAYEGVKLFKPNLKEVSDALGLAVSPDLESLANANKILKDRLSNQITLITLSEKGVFVDDGHSLAIVPTHPRNVADVCGAGDTVISIAALGLACQFSATVIAQLSNLAGGQVVEKVGVVPINFQQLEHEILLQYPDLSKN